MRTGEAVWVTVTEPFDPERLVKRDSSRAPYQEVLKLNDMRTFETGLYDYRTMSSTFLPVAQHTPIKVTASVQEWCGHVYEELRWKSGEAQRTLHSYFEGEQERTQTWPQPSNGWTEDAFPLIMRRSGGSAALAPGENREIQWLPSRVGARLRNDKGGWRPAVLARAPSSRAHQTDQGTTTVDEWSVQVDGVTHRWFVESSWPHGVVGWERSDGERAERIAVERVDYWTRQREADKPLRKRLGLEVHPTDLTNGKSDKPSSVDPY